MPELIDRDRVHSVVGAFYAVYTYYGYGLLESVYCGALAYELMDRGHQVAREVSIAVSYTGRIFLRDGYAWNPSARMPRTTRIAAKNNTGTFGIAARRVCVWVRSVKICRPNEGRPADPHRVDGHRDFVFPRNSPWVSHF